jgi:signal transduction histidine kinase
MSKSQEEPVAPPLKEKASRADARSSGRTGIRIYVALLTVIAAATVTWLAVYRPFYLSSSIVLQIVFLALACLAEPYPIHVAPKTKVSVITAVVFASVLLFEPLAAVGIAGISMAVSSLLLKRKKTWTNRFFDISQYILVTAGAAFVYGFLGTLNAAPALISAYGILRVIAAAATMYLLNTVAVSVIVALQLHKNPAGIWVSGVKSSAVEEMALVAIGLISALLVQQSPWAIVLLLVPVFVIYYSFKHMAALNLKVESQLEELKAAQSQLVESARLAAIGTMAAGIAHQINNPMFVIRGRAETLCEDADEHLKTPSAKRAVQVIFEMADRVSRIVNSLLPHSQISEDGVASSDVNESVRNALLLLEPKILKSNVEVSTALAENLPPCLGEACEIQEMLINLVDNACNAMPEGGKLSISTRITGPGISIRIADTGTGISPDKMANIFNPFFTTRKGCGGVGLGLYVTKHIAEKYGGNIKADSQTGKGTVFDVLLIAFKPKAAGGRERKPREAVLVASGSGNTHRE